MQIRFRDVSSGIVEARAVIELEEGVYLNEVTILKKENRIQVELPQKSFRGKGGKMHHLDIITFENENKKTLFLHEIRESYLDWRKRNKKILIYESE